MYEILQDRFHTQSKEDYNGLTLSLKRITFDSDKNKLVFNFYKSSYYKYLVTNVSPNYKILGNLTIDDYLESASNGKLNRLEDSLAENHLGISCLVILNYKNIKKIIIPKRGNRTTVFKGQLSPSISGALNIHSCSNDEMNPNIKTFFHTEFKEEISELFKSFNEDGSINKGETKKIQRKIKNDIINNLRLIGVSRELLRIGKPEIFFISEIDYDFDDNSKDKIQLNSKIDSEVDLDENKFVYYIDESKIFKLIEEKKSRFIFSCNEDRKVFMNIKIKKNRTINRGIFYFIFSYYKIKKFYVRMKKNKRKERYLLSESLFVNLIFYYKYKHHER